MSGPYLIASRYHTAKSHRYITFWRPNRAGYAWSLPWAGHYDDAEARLLSEAPDEPDARNLAVPLSVMQPFAVSPRPGDIDGDVGPIIRNTKANWALIDAHNRLLHQDTAP